MSPYFLPLAFPSHPPYPTPLNDFIVNSMLLNPISLKPIPVAVWPKPRACC